MKICYRSYNDNANNNNNTLTDIQTTQTAFWNRGTLTRNIPLKAQHRADLLSLCFIYKL